MKLRRNLCSSADLENEDRGRVYVPQAPHPFSSGPPVLQDQLGASIYLLCLLSNLKNPEMSQFNPDTSQFSKLKGKVVVLTGKYADVVKGRYQPNPRL